MGETKAPAAVANLLKNSKNYRWAAITDGSQSAASLELASNGAPVAAIGGFDGEGGQITLAQFQQDVSAGDIHYYIVSNRGGGPGGAGRGGSRSRRFGGRMNSGSEQKIEQWVKAHYKSQTVGGETVYNLSQRKS
ncbi:MAG: hypothetical protein J2O48_04635 [Solirubrobacterales bacterium]|nr:hypothetical protein [Solirubrobacterales bacterium]